MSILFKLVTNNMDLKQTYEYCNFNFSIMAINHIIYFFKLTFRVLCVWLYKVYVKETNQVFGTCTFALIWNMTINMYVKVLQVYIDINLLSSIIQSIHI